MEIMVVKKVQNCSTEIDRNYRSLGWEVALEEEMATHSINLAWEIPRTEEHGRL